MNHQEEKEILEFWKRKKIYEKSIKKNSKGKKFYMMDGPPYATGHIHMGTALNKILKDITMRSHRIQGDKVFDRAGYDTHGVPIEFQIEKEIGSKSKKDIEKFGVKKFIDKCKEFATRYIDVMNSEFENLGVWMDFKNPYLTLDDKYIETIWDTFKVANQKKLLYLGKYPVHICPRCETAVAYNEIEYSKQEDTSIFVKFPLKNKKDTYLIIWTTTPWTLPANTGIMANPNFIYEEIELSSREKWILAKELVPKIMTTLEMGYSAKKEFKGKEMEGWEYENPLSKNIKLKTKNAYKVILSSRYVNLEEGTGLVHCAPGHGKEDYEVGKEYGLDMPSPVALNGLMTKETGKYEGKGARIVDEEIIKDLEKDNFLVYKIKYAHDYPLCWRCKTPLLMIAQPQWFLKISNIQKELLKENNQIYWIPSWMKLRMKAWLEGISDWPVSRMRYWGTPLPIWVCDKCNDKKVIGSVAELRKVAKLSKTKKIGMHKPEIDEITFKCKCGGIMKRVPEVLDVWFDSGVSSWAALPKKELKKFWPADINLEGKDQVRGWWNSQLILSEIRWNKKPMNAILEHGMVLDLGKKKMSKSLGNIITPAEIIEKYSRDSLRYYFAKISKGEDFAFDESEFNEIGKFFRVLLNVNTFVNQIEKEKEKIQPEDRWILSRMNSTIKDVKDFYNSYKYPEAVQAIEKFLIEDFSKTYIKMIRERSGEAYKILNEIRLNLLKILAPIIPFSTEKIWQSLRDKKIVKEESIHLSSWPKADNKLIDKELEKKFIILLKDIISVGLMIREGKKRGIKWGYERLILYTNNSEIKNWIEKYGEDLLKKELNVEKIIFKENKEGGNIKIDLEGINEEIESKGYAREMSRIIQDFRKKLGLNKKEKVETWIIGDDDFKKILEKNKNVIQERTNSKKLEIVTTEKERFKNKIEFKVKDKRGSVVIKK
jgi:isoleucyl-tRNA synthetase